MNENLNQPTGLGTREQIDLLIEEYRALNALLLFRLDAMDKRLSVSVGFLTVIVSSVLALPTKVQLVVLLLLPIVIIWIARTTTTHAQAKEDHLRRIDEIEREVNRLVGRDLLVFQSQHPNRRSPSGRSGQALISLLTFSGFSLLVLCVFLFWQLTNPGVGATYLIYVSLAATDLAVHKRRLTNYCYSKPIRV